MKKSSSQAQLIQHICSKISIHCYGKADDCYAVPRGGTFKISVEHGQIKARLGGIAGSRVQLFFNTGTEQLSLCDMKCISKYKQNQDESRMSDTKSDKVELFFYLHSAC